MSLRLMPHLHDTTVLLSFPTNLLFKSTKCHQHCASKCSHVAKKIASNKKKYCEDYGPDAPPLAPYYVCSEMNQCDECQGDCNSGELISRRWFCLYT